MPLIRLELRNEYGLGDPELYRGAARREEPKAVLDGVAVSGLVGILRQLGDLAGFAAEVFHDLHEQVVATTARGHRMMARIQRIESALPQIEKAVQTQKSHIHFAHLPGSDWHANIQIEHDHLLRSDLPQFIMDSYEECRDPPRLFLLDKFDGAGAGACLKRYSDPTYFKRVWVSSEMIKEDKGQKEKKVHKIKRKGSRMSNREVQHAIALSCHNSSLQFTSPGTDEQSIAAETISTFDMRLKSDLGSRSASFDSRTRVSCGEPATSANSSVQPEEAVNNELPLSKSKIDHNDEYASLTPDEYNRCADDDSFNDSLQEQTGPRSPSVTWDEKTEILKPTSPGRYDDLVERVQKSESPTVSSEQLKNEYEITKHGLLDQEDKSLCVGNVSDQQNISFNTGIVPAALPGANQYDEVTSETENYVDALNTLESETETDSEFQTIREVNPSSIYSCQMENEKSNTVEMGASSSYSPDNCSTLGTSQDFLDKELSQSFSDSISPKGMICSEPLPTIDLAPNQTFSVGNDQCGSYGNDQCGSYESSVPETHENDDAPSSLYNVLNSQTILEDENIAENLETCEGSDEPPIKIWTNGGLLGLEPSKPPDFSVPSTLCQKSGSDNSTNECDLSACKVSSELNNCGSLKKGDANDKPDTVELCDGHGNKEAHNQTQSNVAPAGDKLLATSVAVLSSESGLENGRLPLSLPGLAHKFLANNFQKKASFTLTGALQSSTIPTNSLTTLQENSLPYDYRKQPGRAASQTQQELNPKQKLDHESLEDKTSSSSQDYGPPSPPSPPLEHMKISFHPINGLVTSKLKLEFPDSHLHESIEELMFPSFQLLPGPGVSLQHTSSESDDDTFCRSSNYSENVLSHHSESDSELWEQDEHAGNGSHGMDGVSHIVSPSTASISSSLEFDGMNHHDIRAESEFNNLKAENGLITFQSDHVLNLPGFDSLRSLVSKQDEICDPGLNGPSNDQPPPPPLPPLQWIITKPSLISSEGNQHCFSEVVDCLSSLQVQRSVQHSEKSTPRPPEPSCTQDAIVHPSDIKKSGVNKEVNQADDGKEDDENGGFLHQIRTKSFNLRRTVTTKPSAVPGPTTNVKVAAILEKANAIRQAVVSSDEGGEDENWSDG